MKAKLLVVLALLAFAIPMNATEIELFSGSHSATASGTGTVSYDNANFDGWDIKIMIGDSYSPDLSPYGLDLSSLTATCTGGKGEGCSKDELDVYLIDTGFTTIAPTLTLTYTSTDTGGKGAGTEMAGFFDTGGGWSLIGYVGPFWGKGGFSGSVTGAGPGASSPYSLEIWEGFVSGGTSASFSSDGNITATPEPVSMMLMGTFLSLAGGLLSRKKRA